jgi:hypothetical protein
MKPTASVVLCGLLLTGVAAAQQGSQPAASPSVLPADQQIVAATLAVPADLRAGATVWGYAADRKLVKLRQGTGEMVCLASEPAGQRFHVACYHESMEPFMARGRELRRQGVTGDQVDTVRFAEVRSGKLRMPSLPALLYSLTGEAGSFDPATGTTKGATPLFVIYIPGATGPSTGLSEKPVQGAPWIMFPGTPKAHIMFVPTM